MANHASHGSLPYPIKNARFSLLITYLDADGDPTDPTTPDTEYSGDAGAFADCAEEVTTITGSNGTGYITLTGAETNYSMVALAAKVASGPKNTLATLYPRELPIVDSGTATAGAAGTITLAATAAAFDITGYFIRTTGGTGGGGAGGANNQARKCTAYNRSTRVATVLPSWETTPDSTTTYDVLMPEGCVAAMPSIPGVVDWGRLQSATATTAVLRSAYAAGADDLINGSWIHIVAGTGAGQSRLITDYTNATDTVTVDAWTTNPDSTSVYLIVAAPPGSSTSPAPVNVTQWLGTACATPTVNGVPEVDLTHSAGVAITSSGGRPEVNTTHAAGTAWGSGAITAASIATDAITAAKIAADAITAAKIADGAIDANTFAAGAITAAAIAADAIGASELAADAVAEIADAIWDEATAGHTTAGTFGEQCKTDIDAILADTDVIGATGGGLTSLATQASVNTIDDFLDTEIAAIKAKTDQLTFTVANQVDANAESINATTVLGNGTSGNKWRG